MRSFAQMIANIQRSDDALREAVAETAAYITLQYHRNNRKADGAGNAFMAQFILALPAWLQKEAGKWPLQTGRRNPDMSEREACMRVDAFIGMAFASQEEKRRISRENRAARAERKAEELKASGASEAPKAESATEVPNPIIEGEAVAAMASPNALIVEGQEFELSAEEAQMILRHLQAARATLRIAA